MNMNKILEYTKCLAQLCLFGFCIIVALLVAIPLIGIIGVFIVGYSLYVNGLKTTVKNCEQGFYDCFATNKESPDSKDKDTIEI